MERCRAKNRLTCREHGVPLDFVEVPEYIQENLDYLVYLNEEQLHARSELDAAALMEGLLPSEIGFAAYHDPAGQVPLRTLMHDTLEAELEFDQERTRQYRDALEYVQVMLHRELPGYPADMRYLMSNLVCLRFLIVEKEHGVAAADGYYPRIFGLTRTALFAPLVKPDVRAVISRCDRAFLTFVTGTLPDEEDLTSLAYERIIRRQRPATAQDSMRALSLVERLFDRMPEDEVAS